MFPGRYCKPKVIRSDETELKLPRTRRCIGVEQLSKIIVDFSNFDWLGVGKTFASKIFVILNDFLNLETVLKLKNITNRNAFTPNFLLKHV